MDDVFVFHHEDQKLEKIEYLKEGDIVPKQRNSHSFVSNGQTAYIFGGANNEGPLNDAYEMDLETLKFKRIAITNAETTPFFEMHSSHLYEGNKLLLIGGRSHVLLSQQNDPDALQAAMMKPFRDVIISLDLTNGQV